LFVLQLLLSTFSAIFTYFGLFSFGQLIFKWQNLGNGSFHKKIAYGFGGFYLIYHILVGVLEPKWVPIVISAIFFAIIFFQRKEFIRQVFTHKRINKFWLFIFILFTPYFFRLFSPPVSDDGLSFYLPQVAWLYEYGLKFNPYLTQYTTMPQGVQVLFTLPFGLTGYDGIRFLDALGAFSLLHVLYAESKVYLNESLSKIFVLIALLLKGTIFFLFGTGKIDTWNAYITLIGIFAFFKAFKSNDFLIVFVICSISLSIKYTNWLLFLLPLVFFSLKLIRLYSFKILVFIFLIPSFFAGSVLVRNFVQVNNPFAPAYSNNSETRYVHNHGLLPKQYSNEINYDKVFFDFNFFFNPLFIFFIVLIFILFLSFRRIKLPKTVLYGFFLLILMMIPWFVVFGVSTQPTRFIWGPILLGILILLMIFKEFQDVDPFSKIKSSIFIGLFSLMLIFLVSKKGGRYIIDFFQLSKKSLPEWYAYVGKQHYAISYKIKDLGLHHQKIFYANTIALGAFEVKDYLCFPTQEKFLSSDYKIDQSFNYVLFYGKNKSQSTYQGAVALQYGDYFLIQINPK